MQSSSGNGIPDQATTAGLDPTDPTNASRSRANPDLTMALYGLSSADPNTPITYLEAYQLGVSPASTNDGYPLVDLPTLNYAAISTM